MKLLCEIRHSDIIPGASDKPSDIFSRRHAARAIVTDSEGKVALLYVGKHNFHKLPGGGVEAGEDVQQALARELVEEIGCQATITSELGAITEYRDEWDQKQTSECFIATQTGGIQLPSFTEKELSEGFRIVWADNLAHAISLLENDSPKNYGGLFIRARDLTFLRAANSLL